MIKFKDELFEEIVRATQEELLNEMLIGKMKDLGMTDYVHTEDYLMYHGNVPVMLVAHLDTVHKEPIATISKFQGTWSSPQGIGGDDRCGIYMILDLIEALPFKPYVLFPTDEEVGCLGTKKFLTDYPVNEFEIKFLIEFDRKGRDEAIFYDCDNKDFHEFILENTNYQKGIGSYTDICHIMEKWDVAGVNFSSGYYNAHTLSERVKIGEMMNTIRVVYTLLEKLDFDALPHFPAEIKQKYHYGYNSSYNGLGFGGGYYDGLYYGNYSSWGNSCSVLDESDLESALEPMDMTTATAYEQAIMRAYYHGTWGNVNYYSCECGKTVDEDTFKKNEYYCPECYHTFFGDYFENEDMVEVVKIEADDVTAE